MILEFWAILKHFSSSWGRLISICYFLFLLRAITWIIHFYRCLLYLVIMCKILLSYIFFFFNILFSQQPFLAHQLSHLPCWLPHSLWLEWWCQGQQHLNHLELLRNAESQAHPDLLTQHHVWTRSPSKVLLSHGQFLMSDNLWFPRTMQMTPPLWEKMKRN